MDPVETELVALEKQFWQATVDCDGEVAASLADEPCIVMGAQGVASIDRKHLAEMIENAPYTLRSFELSDVRARRLSDDVAIVVYEVHEDLDVDGERISLDASESSTWVRRNGSWVCALHSEALRGDPFGRDKSSPISGSSSAQG